MIRKVKPAEFDAILEVVNNAAEAYRGVIPADCWKEPYMPAEELQEESTRGIEFYGWFENSYLVAVMGVQPVKDVTLIRHAYVRTTHQRMGIGKALLRHILSLIDGEREVLVGTWAAAWWAVRFYEKNGFRLVSLGGAKTRAKLRQYWTIPDRQEKTSVVLRLQR